MALIEFSYGAATVLDPPASDSLLSAAVGLPCSSTGLVLGFPRRMKEKEYGTWSGVSTFHIGRRKRLDGKHNIISDQPAKANGRRIQLSSRCDLEIRISELRTTETSAPAVACVADMMGEGGERGVGRDLRLREIDVWKLLCNAADFLKSAGVKTIFNDEYSNDLHS